MPSNKRPEEPQTVVTQPNTAENPGRSTLFLLLNAIKF